MAPENAVSSQDVPIEHALIVMRAPRPEDVGRFWMLRNEGFRLGRAEDNDGAFPTSTAISRYHLELYCRGRIWHARDLGSRNGTTVNGTRIADQPLRSGDSIGIGEYTLQYLSGPGLEAQYLGVLQQRSTLDPATGLPNRAHVIAALERERAVPRRDGSLPGVLMLRAERLTAVAQSFGDAAANHALREAAEVMLPVLPPGTRLGFYGSDLLLAVVPATTPDALLAAAEAATRAVRARPPRIDGRAVAFPIAAGAALAREGDPVPAVLEVAEDTVRRAAAKGPGEVLAAWMRASLPAQRLVDAEILLSELLARPKWGGLLAFDLADEDTLIHLRGSEVRNRWFRELANLVFGCATPDERVAILRDRHLLLALGPERADHAPLLARAVRENWSHPGAPESGREASTVRTAFITAPELRELGRRTYDVLLGRLDAAGTPRRGPSLVDRLPYPLVAFEPLVAAQHTHHARLKTTLDGIERALRFVVALELSVLRETSVPALRDALTALLRQHHVDRPMGFGTWRSLAGALAQRLQGNERPWIAPLRSALLGSGPGGPSMPARLDALVAMRNAHLGHGVLRPDPEYAPLEASAREHVAVWLSALEPLTALRVVSQIECRGVVGPGMLGFKMNLHAGPGLPSVFDVSLPSSAELQPNWCHVLDPSGAAPLSLAPIIAAVACSSCRRTEIASAENIPSGPPLLPTRVLGLTTDHALTVPMPYLSAAAAAVHGTTAGW